MKIEVYDGCTTAGLSVDGIHILDKEFDEKAVFERLIEKLRERCAEGRVQLRDVIGLFQYDDYESSDKPCDQCGDYYSTTYYDL